MNESKPHDTAAIVEMFDIRKSFGPVEALRGVDFVLHRGEIQGLVGDNAAGKSTLMKILCGAVIPDAGMVRIDGRQVRMTSPRDAMALGISMNYQDLALFNNLDVASNVFAGREPVFQVLGVRFLRQAPMYRQAESVLADLKISISSPRLLVERMSGGQRQMIAAARAISKNASVLVMDEPTAALGVKESATLLGVMAELRNRGVAIVLITHRIADVLEIGDRVTILKRGRVQATLSTRECDLTVIEDLIVRGNQHLTSDQ